MCLWCHVPNSEGSSPDDNPAGAVDGWYQLRATNLGFTRNSRPRSPPRASNLRSRMIETTSANPVRTNGKAAASTLKTFDNCVTDAAKPTRSELRKANSAGLVVSCSPADAGVAPAASPLPKHLQLKARSYTNDQSATHVAPSTKMTKPHADTVRKSGTKRPAARIHSKAPMKRGIAREWRRRSQPARENSSASSAGRANLRYPETTRIAARIAAAVVTNQLPRFYSRDIIRRACSISRRA